MTQRACPCAANISPAFACVTVRRPVRQIQRRALNDFLSMRANLSVVRPQGNCKLPDPEGLLDLQVRNAAVVRQTQNFSRLQRGNREAIAKQKTISRERGNAWTGRENSLKIQRISRAESEQLTFGRVFAD